MGIWMEVHLLQIYYATINCILFWGWGVPHMDIVFDIFFVLFDTYMLGKTDIEHIIQQTTKIKNI